MLDVMREKKVERKIFECDGFDNERKEKISNKMSYDKFFDGTSIQMVELAQVLKKRLKVRGKIMQERN